MQDRPHSYPHSYPEILLGAGIWIVEGLDLSRAREGPADFACLPIRIAGGEGAPAWAILRQPRPAVQSRKRFASIP